MPARKPTGTYDRLTSLAPVGRLSRGLQLTAGQSKLRLAGRGLGTRPDVTGKRGAAAWSMAGPNIAQASAAPPSKWDQEADVVVLGYGGAAMACAIFGPAIDN